jgi:Uma2 family endonuclease
MKTQLYLTPADDGRPISLDDFLSARHQEGYRYELIEGRIEVSPIADLPHEDYVEWLVETLRAYRRTRPDVIKRVKNPARVFLPADLEEGVTAPEPDIAVFPEYPTGESYRVRDWRRVSPLIVIEVLSEETADKDLVRNRRLYLGVPTIREYWMLDPREDPDRPTLIVLRRRGTRWGPAITVRPGEAYTTRLLPGFRLVIDPHQES